MARIYWRGGVFRLWLWLATAWVSAITEGTDKAQNRPTQVERGVGPGWRGRRGQHKALGGFRRSTSCPLPGLLPLDATPRPMKRREVPSGSSLIGCRLKTLAV